MSRNSVLIPEAKKAMDSFKSEVANSLNVNLKQGDNGDLTSRQAGSIGGEMVKRILDTRRNAPLSPAALEVLAVIAYNQPVSRSFIEQVRGVDSSSTVTKLLDKGLIEEAGRLDLPGKPVAFQVTDTFLRVFGLGSLADLPPLHGETPENSEPEEAEDDDGQLEWK